MKWQIRTIMILWGCFSFLPVSALWAQSVVGTLEVERGSALVTRGEETEKISPDKLVTLAKNDVVQTAPNSSARIILGGGDDPDEFLLGENTTFVIEEYLVEEKKPTRGIFNLLGGKLRSIINRAKGQKDIKVRTSTATIGVKGTDFLTEVPNDQVTRVTTFEGLVEMENRIGELASVSISPGTSSLVMAGATPFAPTTLSRESLLQSAQVVARRRSTQNSIQLESASGILSSDNLINFRQQQFNSLVLQAASVSGSVLNIKIEFPEGS